MRLIDVGMALSLILPLGCHLDRPPEQTQRGSKDPKRDEYPTSSSKPTASACDADLALAASATTVQSLKSPRLSSVAATTSDAVAVASRSMRGVHKIDDRRLAGVDFIFVRLSLDTGSCVASLTAALVQQESDSQLAKVDALTNPARDVIDATFVGWERSTDRAVDPASVLAESLATHLQGLLVYRTEGSRGMSRVSGVALVDKVTREALWIFARVVEPVVQKRD